MRVRTQARYSYQIKQLVVDKYAANESILTIARSLGLPYGTVANWCRKIDMGKDILLDLRGGARNIKITQAISDFIVESIDDECWVTIADLKRKIVERFSVDVGRSTLSHYVLHKLGYSYKVIKCVFEKRNTDAVKDDRIEFVEWLMMQDEYEVNNHFVWIDESGCQINNFKRRGYAPIGMTPTAQVPARGKRINVVGAISGLGIVHMEAFSPTNNRDNFNSEKFLSFLQSLRRVLQNYCDQNNIAYDRIHLLLDNARIHQAEIIEEFFDTCPFVIKFLPRYSPFLNPIEEVTMYLFRPGLK